MKFVPTEEGVLVRGCKQGYDFFRERCIGHVFVTYEPVKSKGWRSGYRQGAYCVVCDEDIPPMDAEWWIVLATPALIRAAARLIKLEIKQLQANHRYLHEAHTSLRRSR